MEPHATGLSLAVIARQFAVSKATIHAVISGAGSDGAGRSTGSILSHMTQARWPCHQRRRRASSSVAFSCRIAAFSSAIRLATCRRTEFGLSAFRATRAFPCGVIGPLLLSQGCQRRMACACASRLPALQPHA